MDDIDDYDSDCTKCNVYFEAEAADLLSIKWKTFLALWLQQISTCVLRSDSCNGKSYNWRCCSNNERRAGALAAICKLLLDAGYEALRPVELGSWMLLKLCGSLVLDRSAGLTPNKAWHLRSGAALCS